VGAEVRLSILYRGPLASCDYECPYCPFAKRRDAPAQLDADRACLERFVGWIADQPPDDELSILFTPWGEALIRSWYREAIVCLSLLPQVRRVAIQTNLSGPLDFLRHADRRTAALWCTYHPGQVRRQRFLDRVGRLEQLEVRHSVGIVGLPEHHDEAVALRAALPPATYLWVNAEAGRSYHETDIARWKAVDPHFGLSAQPHQSLGLSCRTGEHVISVRGDGSITRCHFVDEPLGNLYDGALRAALRPRPCPRPTCDCHIGYVHLEALRLDRVFGEGVLERVPEEFEHRAATTAPTGAVVWGR